ncbi:MAG: molybdate ABC transporter substrate-binding protein [Polyangiales bacterium]
MTLARRSRLAVALVALVSCKRAEPARATLTVFAAASLREAFTSAAREFERQNPSVSVTFSFAGSQELVTQIEHGARADVVACADLRTMQSLVSSQRVRAPAVFARNELVVVVANEGRALVRSFRDLPNATRVVIGAPEVPVGRYTQQVIDRASAQYGQEFRSRFDARVVSRELNVRQVLAKLTMGEAQAAIVYRTDAIAAGAQVAVVEIPAEFNVVGDYPIAVVTSSSAGAHAQRWVDFVRLGDGQRALRASGFLAPTGAEPAP